MPSAAVIQALTAQETDEGFVILLTFSSPEMTTFRICNHRDGFTSRANVFQYYPFHAPLLEQSPDRPPRIELRVDIIDRVLMVAISQITKPPTVAFELVTVSQPDTLEAGPYNLTLKDPVDDLFTVAGELSFEDILSLPAINGTFRPSTHPGLFA